MFLQQNRQSCWIYFHRYFHSVRVLCRCPFYFLTKKTHAYFCSISPQSISLINQFFKARGTGHAHTSLPVWPFFETETSWLGRGWVGGGDSENRGPPSGNLGYRLVNSLGLANWGQIKIKYYLVLAVELGCDSQSTGVSVVTLKQ